MNSVLAFIIMIMNSTQSEIYLFWIFRRNVKQYSMQISEFHHDSAFFSDSVQLTQVCWTVDKNWNK